MILKLIYSQIVNWLLANHITILWQDSEAYHEDGGSLESVDLFPVHMYLNWRHTSRKLTYQQAWDLYIYGRIKVGNEHLYNIERVKVKLLSYYDS